MTSVRATVLGCSVFLTSVGLAHAHAFLDHADPAVGSTVHGSPPILRLWFTEGLEPAFSTIRLLDGAGQTVTTSKASVDKAAQKLLALPLPTLQPGTYKVMWSVISVDTHKTTGSFMFVVAP